MQDDQTTYMTGDELNDIQHKLGYSDRALTDMLGLSPENASRDLRKYKAGSKRIPGTFAFAMYALRDGYLPPWAD